jgi:predicted  nucleic acid-binding Zn-ribbon protein
MEKKQIFLRAGEYKAKWHRCARCGLYFINRSLALDAILKGCPGCIRKDPAFVHPGMVRQLAGQYQADRLNKLWTSVAVSQRNDREMEKSLQPVAGLNLPDPGAFNAKMHKLVTSLIATAIMGVAFIAVVIGGIVTALQKLIPPKWIKESRALGKNGFPERGCLMLLPAVRQSRFSRVPAR